MQKRGEQSVVIALSLHFACVSGITSEAAYSSGSPGFQSAAGSPVLFPLQFTGLKEEEQLKGSGRKWTM